MAFKHCEAAEPILPPLAGRPSSGHMATKEDVAQLAKVVYCLCCVIPTHIAAPPSCSVGEWDELEARGFRLRGRFGHWAG